MPQNTKTQDQNEHELWVQNLAISFKTQKGTVKAVRGIDFYVDKGETLAIVGESGSGKSVSAKAILGIEAPNAIIESGHILYGKDDVLQFSERELNRIRGSRITMIFQDPLSSLDPIVKIGHQLTEASILNGRTNQKRAKKELKALQKNLKGFLSHTDYALLQKAIQEATKMYARFFKKSAVTAPEECTEPFFVKELESVAPGFLETFTIPEAISTIEALLKRQTFTVTKKVAYKKAISIMGEVGISEPEKRFEQYPFEFSGGMRQRIVIAIAIAANPDLLICDEPTTALDVTIQAQILELINRLKETRKMSVIFITHDMGVVANVADRIAVMYAGKIVEIGTAEDIFYEPAHPYTWALLSSIPDLDTKEKLEAIPGTPPDMLHPPKGDAFAARNRYAMKIDFEQEPPLFKISETHYAATWLLHPNAPAVEPPRIVTQRIARMKNQNGDKSARYHSYR